MIKDDKEDNVRDVHIGCADLGVAESRARASAPCCVEDAGFGRYDQFRLAVPVCSLHDSHDACLWDSRRSVVRVASFDCEPGHPDYAFPDAEGSDVFDARNCSCVSRVRFDNQYDEVRAHDE